MQDAKNATLKALAGAEKGASAGHQTGAETGRGREARRCGAAKGTAEAGASAGHQTGAETGRGREARPLRRSQAGSPAHRSRSGGSPALFLSNRSSAGYWLLS